MKKLRGIHYFILALCFLFALTLEILPWPQYFQGTRPAWLVMMLMYWILALPERISVITSFVVGIAWDLITGSVLGLHSFVLVIFGYLVCVNCTLLRSLSLWFQSFLVMFFVIALRLGFFLLEFLLFKASFDILEIYGAVLTGILWPWLVILLHKIRYQFKFH